MYNFTIDQGTIIYGIRSSKYPTVRCYGVIITARCDIAQKKVLKYYLLVAVDASEWFCTEHGYEIVYSGVIKSIKKEIALLEKQTGKQFNVLDKSDERDPAKLTLSSPYAINCLEFQGVILIGVDEGRVADAFNALIRCAKVGITTKNDVVKQTGTIAGANVLLLHEQLDELTVDPAARIVYQLLDFQFVF